MSFDGVLTYFHTKHISMKYLIVILICSIVHITQGQSSEYSIAHDSNHDLIQGTWYFDYASDDFSQELIFNDKESFRMTSVRQGNDTLVQEGTYTVKGDMLRLNFTDGALQVNEITLLNDNELKFVYIETIYMYTRIKNDN